MPKTVALIAIALISVALRLPFLSVPMESDEGAYAYVAYFWGQGDVLYRDVLIFRPQAILVIYRIIFSTLGTSIEATHLFAALYNSLTVLLVYLTARYFLPKGYSLLAASLFGLFSVGPMIQGFTANAEPFMNLPATISAFFLLRAARTNLLMPNFFLSAFFAGLAAQVKPSGVAALALGFLFIFFLMFSRKDAREASFLLKTLGGLVLGLVLSLLPALAHGFTLGWGGFLYSAIGFSVTRASPAQYPIIYHLLGALYSSSLFLVDGAFLVLASLIRLVLPKTRTTRSAESLLWLWLFSATLGIAAGAQWWAHYYIQALPPLCILASLGLMEYRAAMKLNGRSLVLGLSLMMALIYTGVQELPVFFYSPSAISQRMSPGRHYPWAKEIADYITARTGPEERIYGAFSTPDLYFLARRRAAFPYLFLGERELARLPGAAAELAEVLNDEAKRPTYVVIAREPITGFGTEAFYQALERNYVLETRIGPTLLYRKMEP